MKCDKLYRFDLEDLGNTLSIQDVSFSSTNTFGIFGIVTLRIKDKKVVKDIGLDSPDIIFTANMKAFMEDECVQGYIFETDAPLTRLDMEFDRDGFISKYIFETWSDDSNEPIYNVMANDNLIHVLEAYITAQFYKKMGCSIDENLFEMKAITDLMGDDLVNYIVSYLVAYNYNVFIKTTFNGSDIDYPNRGA